MMEETDEDVQATIDRLQREWLEASGEEMPGKLGPYKPSYCYGCARTAGVAVYRKPQPDKKRKGETSSSSRGSSLQGRRQAKARPVPNPRSASNLKVSAHIKKRALNTLLGQKTGRANHPLSTVNGTRKPLTKTTNQRKNACDKCGKFFASGRNLRRHQLNVHVQVAVDDAAYSCGECGKTFLSEKPYLQHLQIHEPISDGGGSSSTPDRPYACDECDRTFSRIVNLTLHKKTHDTDRPFSCQFCLRAFKRERNLVIHEKTHVDILHPKLKNASNLKVTARIKKKALTTLLGQKAGRANHPSSAVNGTRRPLAKKATQQQYMCDECGKVLACNRNLKRHKQTHLPVSNLKVMAQIKKKTLTTLYGQKMGRANHPSSEANGTRKPPAKKAVRKDKKWACDECGKVLANYSNLKRHRQIHFQVEVDAYSCTECGETFPSEKPYMLHLQSHEPIGSGDDSTHRPYACDECDKTFSRFVYLSQHKKIHNTDRPFGCQYCPRMFKTERNLLIHEKTHMEILPFPCEICGIAFTRNTYLQLHQKVHTKHV